MELDRREAAEGGLVAFIQTIEFRTTHIDEINALEHQWRRDTYGKSTLRRTLVLRDRNDAEHYTVVAFFDSYDSAMKNSSLPETSEVGQKQAALTDGGLTFTDYEVVEDYT
jgi:hypothetical protein